MRKIIPTKPWTAGPKELLEHAFEHLAKGNPFDFRIAMISIDNAVELAIKTYLGLPERIRGSKGPSQKRLQEAVSSFPSLLDLLEEFAIGRLSSLDLGDIEVYHRLRNTLYHDGNGITVDPEHVDSYLQIAKVLLNNLLGIAPEKDEFNPPSSLLGGLVTKWASLVQEVRQTARVYLDKEESPEEPVLHTVDRLITNGVLDTQFRRRLRDVNNIRNKFMHSVSVPLNEEDIRNLLDELDELEYYLKRIHEDNEYDEKDRPKFNCNLTATSRLEKNFTPYFKIGQYTGDTIPQIQWRFRGPHFPMNWRQEHLGPDTTASATFNMSNALVRDDLVNENEIGLEIVFYWRGRWRSELHKWLITRKEFPNKVHWDIFGDELLPPKYLGDINE